MNYISVQRMVKEAGASNQYGKVKKIVVDQLGINENQVFPESRFVEDFRADELDHVEMIMALEEALGQAISYDEAEKLTTVGEVAKFIESRRKEQGTNNSLVNWR